MLSYHRVQEAIAAKLLYFIYIPGSLNPADILSKAWVLNRLVRIEGKIVLGKRYCGLIVNCTMNSINL